MQALKLCIGSRKTGVIALTMIGTLWYKIVAMVSRCFTLVLTQFPAFSLGERRCSHRITSGEEITAAVVRGKPHHP